jgi:hypothetical protein
LLDIRATAAKIDMSIPTFKKYRPGLEAAGFPPPCLAADMFGVAKWDERAIDLWLDSRMPKTLRQRLDKREVVEASRDWSTILEQRAQGLQP